MQRYGHAVLGGTFDRLHVGHAALLGAAFAEGRRVSIGLSTDAFVRARQKSGGRSIRPYSARARTLRRWLARRFPRRTWAIVPLADRFGRSAGPGVDILIVSAETAAGGAAVNAERRRRGRSVVPVRVVPVVLAEDLRPVSSSRIRSGEIDRKGRRLRPIRLGIAAEEPADGEAAGRAVRRAWAVARPRAVRVGRVRSDDPTVRAESLARSAARGGGLGVGIVRRRNGWLVAEASEDGLLDARPVVGRRAADLGRGVVRLLRPARPQSL
jgi:cytidyltransferase-like protein